MHNGNKKNMEREYRNFSKTLTSLNIIIASNSVRCNVDQLYFIGASKARR